MNKQPFTLSLLLVVFLYSCGDDDDDGLGSLPDAWIGSWSTILLNASDCTDDSDNGTCSVGCLNITFDEQGRYTGQFYNESITGTAKGNETTLELCSDDGNCSLISYSITPNGTTIKWTDGEDGCDYNAIIVRPNFPSELVGTWTSDMAQSSNCDDTADNGTCTEDCLTYTFDEGGSFEGVFLNEPERMGFGYASGSNLYLCWFGEFACEVVTYEVSEESGSVSWEDDEDGCTYSVDIVKK